jgi:aspartate racemase
MVLDASQRICSAGADFIVLCANTLHRFADELEKEIPVPILHIAGAAAKKIKEHGLSTVGLLGTKQTMELDFYISRLKNEGIDTLVPDKNEREFINNTIMGELLKGIQNPSSKAMFKDIMKKLGDRGAEGIILGCTEIPTLIGQGDSELPLFNTTAIHAQAAAEYAITPAHDHLG